MEIETRESSCSLEVRFKGGATEDKERRSVELEDQRRS
jgi:hypothetical protein